MGKHKEKRSKHKKAKKHKKKSRKHSSSSESSSEDEWVEKPTKTSRKHSSSSSEDEEPIKKQKHNNDRLVDDSERDDWLKLTSLSSTNETRRNDREEKRKQEREKQQYDPKTCPRELNPYWKNGGDGLPKFKRPDDSDNEDKPMASSSSSRKSSWRKPKEDRKYEEKNDIVYTNKPEPMEVEPKQKVQEIDEDSEQTYTEKDLNLMASKALKAEIMGNMQLAKELRSKLEQARLQVTQNKSDSAVEDVILTHTDQQGRSQPLSFKNSDYTDNKKRKKKMETHKDGHRERYYPDDDKYNLKEMFEREKYNTVEDQNGEFLKMSSKVRPHEEMDDVFSDNIRFKQSDSKTEEKQKSRAISEHQKLSKSLDNCANCLQSERMLKHLMISLGETVYLALPTYEPLVEGHCIIVPNRHVGCATQLDENEWAELLDARRQLVQYFKARDLDVVFFETAIYLHKHPHMVLQCVPMPKEEGDLAPIYFKKAIDESETEWSMNKKLVSLKGRDVRKAIPKGLPYFFVSFGMEEGFAHVIEDEQYFPTNFAEEILGGMLDLHHSKWRKPKRENFQQQSARVLEFSKMWHKYDWTKQSG